MQDISCVKISFIIPVYCAEKYLDRLYESIKHQNFNDYEAIFVDDGSIDSSPRMLEKYAQLDQRIQVIHKENGGVSSARNVGLERAKGKYVFIIDSDDWLADGALNALWNEAEASNADLIYGDFFLEEEKKRSRTQVFSNSFRTCDKSTIKALHMALNAGGLGIKIKAPSFTVINDFGGAPWRALIRRAVISDNNLRYDVSLKCLGEDILFMQHIYEYVSKVSYISEPIYHYRMLESSLSHSYKSNLLEQYKEIFLSEEEYLIKYAKDTDYWSIYYVRVINYIQQAMKLYFVNKKNLKPESARYEEFRLLMEEEPYKKAVNKVPLHRLTNYKTKLLVMILKIRGYKLFWIIKKKMLAGDL